MPDDVKDQEGKQDQQDDHGGAPDTGSSNNGVDLAAEIEKWKGLARKHEERSKVNAVKARRFDEIEEAAKTELDKANDRATQAEQRVTLLEAQALRATVAAAKGVPVELLSGSTIEELEAAADQLIAFRGTPPKAPPAKGQGDAGDPVGGDANKITSVDALKSMSPEQINEARRAGRLDDLLKA